MNNNNNKEDRKSNRRKNFDRKKPQKHYFDDDVSYHQKLNKQFKHQKQKLLQEEEDLDEWQYYK